METGLLGCWWFGYETHFQTVTYHGELDGVKRIAGKNLSVEAGIDHRRLNFLFHIRTC